MSKVIALAGNPNSGKTTLFNALTGSNQYVGNWPGVTVEKKEGKLKGYDDVVVTDLPGIYSLSPYTLEEVVSRNYLLDESVDVIINIVDGTNLERNLYLTTQLIEIGLPMVVAVNMGDIIAKSGDTIDNDELSNRLGCPVVEISALKGTDLKKLTDTAISLAGSNKKTVGHPYSGAVEHALAHIEEYCLHDLDDNKQRWYAIKLFERDEKVIEKLGISSDKLAHIENDIAAAEKEYDDDAESIITNERYVFIGELLQGVYKKASGEMSISDRIDKIVTNRFLALPIFVVVMFLVYYIAVSSLGTIVTDWTNDVFVGEWLQGGATTLLESIGASDLVISFIVDGIIGGIGTPIGFAPQMAILFFLLSFLEDCGYMARVAFIMDRIFRRFGLSGKSFIPFLISSGCGVPGIMATRTIENEKDRRMTIMTTTSIPCGAKLPVIALVAGYIMGDDVAWWITPCMIFYGMAVVLVSCFILKKTIVFAVDPVPFVMELPQYHWPSLKNMLLHTWERVWHFLKKAGTILFACCAVMWVLSTFGFEDGSFGMVDVENSLMATIGNAISPVFAPLGFGTWQAVAASISGFVAKEQIVSTMGIFAGIGAIEEYAVEYQSQFAAFFPSTIAAISFLVFNCFDSPCLAAISTAAKELNNRKNFWFMIAFQNVVAWLLALLVYQLGGLIVGQVSFNFWTVVALVVLVGVIFLLFRPDPNKKKQAA